MAQATGSIDLPDFDPLRLVYLLVLDGQGPPDLLTHLDPSRVKEATTRFFTYHLEDLRERGQSVDPRWVIEVQNILLQQYPDIHPHPLWRTWMEITQSAAVERLRAELLGMSLS